MKCLELLHSRQIKISDNLLCFAGEFKFCERGVVLLQKAGIKRIWVHGRKPPYVACWMNGKLALIHRVLLQEDGHEIKGIEVDHKNGNPLDNRLSNLRPATRTENSANRKIHRNNSCGYKGVYLYKKTGKWHAALRNKVIARCDTAEDAARAYNTAAKKRYGKFAKLNAC